MRLTFLILLFLSAFTALAQQTDTPAPEDRATRLDRAQRLHEQATAIRDEAERQHAAAQPGCWKKFLVSSCIEDTDNARRAENIKARELDKQARDIEREVKREDIAERETKRVADAPAKAAAAAAKAEKNRKTAEESQQEVARKQAEAATRQTK
jgi:colicin import membrane protein